MNRTETARRTTTGVVALLVVLLTSTSFSVVLADWRWFPPAVMTATAVAGTGIALRMRRDSWWGVPVQFATLVVMLTALFGDDGVLGLIPTLTTFEEFSNLLGEAVEVIRTGIPPVPAESAIVTLVCSGIGVVTILVDRIAVTCRAPAVAGLVLLCMFAIPASLADRMLPWWVFAGSALGFAVLLPLGVGLPRSGKEGGVSARRLSEAVTVTAMACVVGLLAGAVFTGVGTRGRIPGADRNPTAPDTGEIGLRPFTSLRGQLTRDEEVELFRVEGLPRDTYLRAMTLSRFDPERGWRLGRLPEGIPVQGRLPMPPGAERSTAAPKPIEIEPVGYRDAWLPVFGVPRQVSGIGEDWRYDPDSGMVFTRETDDTESYTELAVLPDPSKAELRASSGNSSVDRAYIATSGAGKRVRELARRITANADNRFDRALALNNYFTDPTNGFSYELGTAPPSSHRALEDFLFRGKRGYCEQFASAMAVLLREIGIPSRVAVGFTSGRPRGDERVITTEDAHAWVEAHFPGHGWVTFDPTPLADGRGSTPSYLDSTAAQQQDEGETTPTSERTTNPTQRNDGTARQEDPRADSGDPAGPGIPIGILLLCGTTLVVLLASLGAPATLRTLRSGRRSSLITAGGFGAAENAWRELLDEATDRGELPPPGETPRRTADRISGKYEMSPEQRGAWHELASAVERERYGPPGRRQTASSLEILRRAKAGLRAARPLGFRERLLPRSVLRLPTRGNPTARH
ncbi:transglutaminase TgpA family protein [Actinopolyspora sp. H202]|uniref:transglutaminase TgpA family protein n=1 Tax=Actinopolyspora sp. H202 TaxID=1500456 RepID=UPI003EE7E7A2